MPTLKESDIIDKRGRKRTQREIDERFALCRENIEKSVKRTKVDWNLLRKIIFK